MRLLAEWRQDDKVDAGLGNGVLSESEDVTCATNSRNILFRGLEQLSNDLKSYYDTGDLTTKIEWGPFEDLSHYLVLAMIRKKYMESFESGSIHHMKLTAKLSIHGIAKRPAMALVASTEVSFQNGSFPELSLRWNVQAKNDEYKKNCHNDEENLELKSSYPEYLAILKISCNTAFLNNSNELVSKGGNDGDVVILNRCMHITPPPNLPFTYNLEDLIWAPRMFPNDLENAKAEIDSIMERQLESLGNGEDPFYPRDNAMTRRGFGLELETVQMHPDYESECFTHAQQFVAAVQNARKAHIGRLIDNKADTSMINIAMKMWDHLSQFTVSHDLYVENNAPPSRVELYQRIQKHISSSGENGIDLRALDNLIFGGRVKMPLYLLEQCNVVTPESIPISQASPEYKSPVPPNELYHVFPPPPDGRDHADSSIRLLLNGVLKNPEARTKNGNSIIVPLVSDIGQSATSIHVHVNVTNEKAWPRQQHCLSPYDDSDLHATNSLLCVIFGWIVFDRVTSTFAMPNMIRDRSLAPMYASGPEFVWMEHSWDQGKFVVVPDKDRGGEVNDMKPYNLPEWFRHVFDSYRKHALGRQNCCNINSSAREEKKEEASRSPCPMPIFDETSNLFLQVFNHEIISNTISRWNSLNLMSLKQYGTLEFRRMHATLNADFVSAWTWFCVGFVEKFSNSNMFEKFLYPFVSINSNGGISINEFGEADSWRVGLERLANAQNHATIEDLIEIMDDKSSPIVPTNTISILLGKK